jgi:hypothetical protein
MARSKGKGFLPKRIAGVKVPKKVRQGRFGELLASPTGQKVIAEAILAAGALAAGAKAADHPAVKATAKKAKDKVVDAKDKVLDAGGGATEQVGDTSGALAYAIGEAARSFADALRRGGPSNGGGSWTPESQSFEASGAQDAPEKQSPAYEAGPL